ncbi:hypothetical protein C8J57DRAFT_1211247 [Mycena rebaudengoi]|nr:hypothetical protein C8J57DRAFT_1211247 [Mycena rebaudengoi]
MLGLRLARPCLRVVPRRRLFSDVAPSAVPIPDKVKGWPTPWITEEDADNYLFPLYMQGWYIAVVKEDGTNNRVGGLSCRFSFSGHAPAAAFVRDVFALADAENASRAFQELSLHHPSWLKLSNLSASKAVVHLCTHTHSALRPVYDEQNDTPAARTMPGPTLRDLRLAALVAALPAHPPVPTADFGPSPLRPVWADLAATLRDFALTASPPKAPKTQTHTQKKPCPICTGAHTTAECPVRRASAPPDPCAVCGGAHWRVDCPLRWTRVDKSVLRREVRAQTRMERAREPATAPCPNCGGAHWKVDCRVPQAPPDALKQLEMKPWRDEGE